MATYVPDATNASEPVGTRPISTAAPEFRALKQRVNQLTTGMGKNKIINGKMDIAQRGTSFAAVGAGTYTLDRWRSSSNATSAAITVSQQSDVPSSNEFQNSMRLAVTTADTTIASVDQVNIQQRIEGYNVRDLIGRTFTLSFWVRSSKTGTHCVYIQNDAQDRSYVVEYTVSAANTWEQRSITVSGPQSLPRRCCGTSPSFELQHHCLGLNLSSSTVMFSAARRLRSAPPSNFATSGGHFLTPHSTR